MLVASTILIPSKVSLPYTVKASPALTNTPTAVAGSVPSNLYLIAAVSTLICAKFTSLGTVKDLTVASTVNFHVQMTSFPPIFKIKGLRL